MSIALFERLVGYLTVVKQTKPENQSLSLTDFAAAVGQLKTKLPEIHAREIRGSRLTRSDAQKEAALVLQLYKFTREMQSEHTRVLESTREAALSQRKTVYLPMAHPEEP